MQQGKPKIIRPEDASGMTPDLPEAGYKRREELARRQDTLAEAVETAAAENEVEAIDISKLKPDGEIRQHLHVDPFSGVVDYFIAGLDTDNFRYALVNSKNPQNSPGMMISRKIAQGWEPVLAHQHKEGANLPVDAEGRRYIGDTVLMRITKERAAFLTTVREQRRAALENVDGTLKALGAQHGVNIGPVNERAVRRGLMRGMASQLIATGNIPGDL